MSINFYKTKHSGIGYTVDDLTIELDGQFNVKDYHECVDDHFDRVMKYLRKCYQKGRDVPAGLNPHAGEKNLDD